jgi:DNA-binding NarL/FixJ family response regulator
VNGIMLTDDLIFFSRVSSTARAYDCSVKQARTMDVLLSLAKADPPGGVILDLQNESLNLSLLMARLAADFPTKPRVIAYGSHVEAAVLRNARAAGCDLVMPRSQFVEKLETEIADWLSSTS